MQNTLAALINAKGIDLSVAFFTEGTINMLKVYEEIIDFIAAGVSPGDVSTFTPSKACRERVADLIHLEKTGALSPEEKSELEYYPQIEHLMRLAKARVRQRRTPVRRIQ